MQAGDNVKRATLRTDSARRPLARTPVTKRAFLGCVGGLGVPAMRYDCNPTQGAVVVVRFSQLRRPATLLPIPRHVLRVGAGFRAGSPGLGDRAFSSGSLLAAPGFRGSFVLRDNGHSKAQLRAEARSLRAVKLLHEVAVRK